MLVFARGRLIFDGEPTALSGFAENRVWEVRTGPGEAPQLAADAIRAEETPLQDGGVVHRVLAGDSPGASAEPVPATLEDGYMWLLNTLDASAAPPDAPTSERS